MATIKDYKIRFSAELAPFESSLGVVKTGLTKFAADVKSAISSQSAVVQKEQSKIMKVVMDQNKNELKELEKTQSKKQNIQKTYTRKLQQLYKEASIEQKSVIKKQVEEEERGETLKFLSKEKRLKKEAESLRAQVSLEYGIMKKRLEGVAIGSEQEYQIRLKSYQKIASLQKRADSAETRGKQARGRTLGFLGGKAGGQSFFGGSSNIEIGENLVAITEGVKKADFSGIGAALGGQLGGIVGSALNIFMETEWGEKVGKFFHDLFTSADTQIAETQKEIQTLQQTIVAISDTKVSIDIALGTGTTQNFQQAITNIYATLDKLPESIGSVKEQIAELMNQPGGPTIADLEQINTLLDKTKEKTAESSLAKQFEVGEKAVTAFGENVQAAFGKMAEAGDDSAKKLEAQNEIETQMEIAVRRRLAYMEAIAKQNGEEFDKDKATQAVLAEITDEYTSIADGVKAASGFAGGYRGIIGDIDSIQGSIVENVSTASANYSALNDEARANEQTARTINDLLASQDDELNSIVDEAMTYQQTSAEQVDSEVQALRVKQANMRAIKQGIDAQIASLQLFIRGQITSGQLADDMAKQQKIISDIMAAQKSGESYAGPTTAAKTMTFESANAAILDLQAKSVALGRGIDTIGNDINSLEKTGKHLNEVQKTGSKDREKSNNDALEQAKKELEEREKLRKSLADIENKKQEELKKLADAEQEERQKALDEKTKSDFEQISSAQQRREAEAKMVEAIRAAGDAIKNAIDTSINKSFDDVDKMLDRFRSSTERLKNSIEDIQKETRAQIDTLNADVAKYSNNISEINNEIAKINISKAEAARRGGPAVAATAEATAQLAELERALIRAQAAESSAMANAEAADRAAAANLANQVRQLRAVTASAKSSSKSDMDALRKTLDDLKLVEISGTELIEKITGKSIDITNITANELEQIKTGIDTYATTQPGVNAAVAAQSSGVSEIESQKAYQEAIIRKNAAAAAAYTNTLEALNKQLDAQNAALEEATGQYTKARAELGKLGALEIASKTNEAAKAVIDLGERLREQKKDIDNVKTAIIGMNSEQEVSAYLAQIRSKYTEGDMDILREYAKQVESADYQATIMAGHEEKATEEQRKRAALMEKVAIVTREVNADSADYSATLAKLNDKSLNTYRILVQFLEQDPGKALPAMDKYLAKLGDVADAHLNQIEIARRDAIAERDSIAQRISALQELQQNQGHLTSEQIDNLQKLGVAYSFLADEINNSSGDIAKSIGDTIDDVVARVKQGIDIFNGSLDMIEAFSQGGEKGVQAGVGKGLDLTQQIGEALLGSTNPQIKLVGAAIVGGALIGKAIMKIRNMIKGEQISDSARAENQAAKESAINALYESRLNIIQTLNDLGDVALDQAKERLAAEQQIHDMKMAESAIAREYGTLSNEQLENSKSDLAIRRERLQIELADFQMAQDAGRDERANVLNKYSVAWKHSTKDEIEKHIDYINGELTKMGMNLDAINSEEDYRKNVLKAQKDILTEQVDLTNMLLKLGEDELVVREKITQIRAGDLVLAIKRAKEEKQRILDAMGGGRTVDPRVFDALTEAVRAGDFENAKEILLSMAETMPDIFYSIKDQTMAWIDAEQAVSDYNKTLDKTLSILEKKGRLNDERLRSSEIDEAEHDRRKLEILQEQLDYILAHRDNYESELDYLIAIESTEADIYELQKKMNGEMGKGNDELVKMIRNYQSLLRSLRESQGGATSAQAQSSLAASQEEMRVYLKSQGQSDEQIDAFINTLPKYERGGPLNRTGAYFGHAGEFVVNKQAVSLLGKDFLDALNKGANVNTATAFGADTSTATAFVARTNTATAFLAHALKRKEAAQIQHSNYISMAISQNFASMAPGQAKEMMGQGVVGAVQRAIDSGKLNPYR